MIPEYYCERKQFLVTRQLRFGFATIISAKTPRSYITTFLVARIGSVSVYLRRRGYRFPL